MLEARTLSHADVTEVLGLTRPGLWALQHFGLAGFSIEQLMNFLTALDEDVEIVIRPKPRWRKAAGITVVAA